MMAEDRYEVAEVEYGLCEGSNGAGRPGAP